MDWKDGYVAGIEYVNSFHPELGPASLNFALMMNGIEPVPLTQGFSYCELGCGQGNTVNLLAACHPEGEFHAVDFNPVHIINAIDMASKANLTNITFWEMDFADLVQTSLPKFDFIAMHGVYSWVSAEKRAQIVQFIHDRLKPDGVVCNGYNSLPGWAAHSPLRELLTCHADTQSGTLLERIDTSVKFVEDLKGMETAYFNVNSHTGSLFDTISLLPRNYLAHEFFNRDWVPFYHADVVKDFAQADLSFAGSARFDEFKDSLRFTTAIVQLLNKTADTVMKETIKDFAANQQFRSDIFTRGRTRLSSSAQMQQLLNIRFALTIPRSAATAVISFPVGIKKLHAGIYDPILSALEKRNSSLVELCHLPQIARFEATMIIEALIVLCAAKYIMPVFEASPETIASTRAYNRSILQQTFDIAERQFLASPLQKNGVTLNWPEQLLLLSMSARADDPIGFTWQHMQNKNHKLTNGGNVLQSDEENFEELCRMAEQFKTEQLPILRNLMTV